ncbi:hypothetical protein VA7868_02209 [Vibrio aerogenes CECT 7868]|uniref:YqcC-like domain-containing protein n=1 Tax=Vibrio aerogenes CECT 7868 TaxID=1216006 RepID=A0A1M5Z268_9VIBR|nr:YqcC family protein [Vibrio aerogenes]SHI18365.1 hypothetical protein VA7868_02209 [Vibrio aerogenes CECT 7868]
MHMQSSIVSLLVELEALLKQQALWQSQVPSAQALSSTQPFALDTLAPHEWLQWIFLPEMQRRMSDGIALPQGFEMSPYFSQAWQEEPQRQALINLIQRIEQECNHA